MHCNRVVRWLVFLNQFDNTVEYIAGKDNTVPDILSRYTKYTTTTTACNFCVRHRGYETTKEIYEGDFFTSK